jgi:hypothetical protein
MGPEQALHRDREFNAPARIRWQEPLSDREIQDSAEHSQFLMNRGRLEHSCTPPRYVHEVVGGQALILWHDELAIRVGRQGNAAGLEVKRQSQCRDRNRHAALQRHELHDRFEPPGALGIRRWVHSRCTSTGRARIEHFNRRWSSNIGLQPTAAAVIACRRD